MPRDAQGNYYSRKIDLTDGEEVVERLLNARKGVQVGARVGSVVPLAGSAVGATLGGIAGFILGDQTTVFPIDMIAIPAYQAYMLNGTPAFQIYIKEGEVLTQVQATDAMMSEAIVEEEPVNVSTPRKRKPGAGLPRKYAKMGFKKGWREYKKTATYKRKQAAKKKKTRRKKK